MKCPRIDELLKEAPTADALAHAKTCQECGPARAAWDAMNGAAASTASLQKARDAARAELKVQPKSRKWWVDATFLLGVNLAVAILASSLLSVRAFQPESQLSRWGISAALFTMMIVGAWAAVRPGAHLLRIVLLVIAAAGAIWVGIGGSGLSGDRPFSSGIACALTEAAVCFAPLLVVLWITSRFAFEPTRAIVGGLSVGATGMFVLHFHCANGSAEHLFTFHVLPWLVVGLGTLAIRRMLPSRSFAS